MVNDAIPVPADLEILTARGFPVPLTSTVANPIWGLLYLFIKTHGSESRGQERAKRSPKTKRATYYCVSERFRHLTS